MGLPYEYWRENCHRPIADLAREHGRDPSNFRRDEVLPAKRAWPELPWKGGSSVEEPVKDSRWQGDSHEILGDGTHRTTKLLVLDKARLKDKRYLLEAHGFDPDLWKLTYAKSAAWNVRSDEDGVSTLFSSRITVEPLPEAENWAALMSAAATVQPETVDRPEEPGRGMLEVDLFDVHLGCTNYCDYRTNVERIVELIESRTWDVIVIPVGSDLYHTDNFRGTTSNGTNVGTIDWEAAWTDGARLFGNLIGAALRHARVVKVVYVKGNHCESMSWAFCQFLKAKWPQAEVDTSIRERKVVRWLDVAVGLTHGDKAMKDIDRVFMAEFPEFRDATVREIHGGHHHIETTQDRFGIMVRRAPTGNRTDQWHADNGFVGANKRFLAFRYSRSHLDGVDYV